MDNEAAFRHFFSKRLIEDPTRSLLVLVTLANEDVEDHRLEEQANENEALRLAEAGLSNY